MSCKYCNIQPDDTGDCIIEERPDVGVYIYREIDGTYCLVQNMLECSDTPIVACPMCGAALVKEPLTIAELIRMEDVPIWVRPNSDNDLWCVWDGERAEIPGCDHWWWGLNDYGETWLAYRQKPE